MRRIVWSILISSVLGGAAIAEAQQQPKIPKIGWLGARTPSGPGGGPGTGAESFRRKLSKLGYVEGKDITIEYRYADDQLDRLPGLVDELVRLKIDLLIAPRTVEARAAKNATRTIPIVFLTYLILLRLGWLIAWHSPGGTSRG